MTADEYQYPEGLCAPIGACDRCGAKQAIIGFTFGTRVLSLCSGCTTTFTDAFVADGPAAALEGMVRDLTLAHSPIGGTA